MVGGTEGTVAEDGLELLVEALVASRPVDVAVDVGEEEFHELLEVGVQDLLPHRIVAGHMAMTKRKCAATRSAWA